MPDRRQADRRENNGKLKKEIKISLTSFIMTIVFFLLIIAGILFSKYFYDLGYTKGSNDGYVEGYEDVYRDLTGYEYGYGSEETYEE